MTKINELNEIEVSILKDILINGSMNTVESLGKFINWVGVSLSAAIVLIVSNLKIIESYFILPNIKIAIYFLFISIILMVIQKYMIVFVQATVSQSKHLDEIFIKYQHQSENVDFIKLKNSITDSSAGYLRWFLRYLDRKENLFAPRTAIRCTQIVGTLVLVQLIFILISLSIIVLSIK